MANPVVNNLVANTWTKVATNTTKCTIRNQSSHKNYVWTYRTASDTTPINDTESVMAFVDYNYLAISESAAVDVYIKSVSLDGCVRVDIIA